MTEIQKVAELNALPIGSIIHEQLGTTRIMQKLHAPIEDSLKMKCAYAWYKPGSSTPIPDLEVQLPVWVISLP
ncbi:hypothetical protein BJD55_gp094 [Gordonia phage Yvonnetastic]|uniref:Uncharacterized protein n=1 Tax=Gordonia phage Yvonnetastic TaxID=1821566 RepID=A0A142K989_9CAUD|nr:hypothetical protein BJD55_gp094 [Gordonia phage Yvonnetastic]AMS02672.1 hypothetical protein SEA_YVONNETASTIC_128 [Gordonia phage Yvonnetastic]